MKNLIAVSGKMKSGTDYSKDELFVENKKE